MNNYLLEMFLNFSAVDLSSQERQPVGVRL